MKSKPLPPRPVSIFWPLSYCSLLSPGAIWILYEMAVAPEGPPNWQLGYDIEWQYGIGWPDGGTCWHDGRYPVHRLGLHSLLVRRQTAAAANRASKILLLLTQPLSQSTYTPPRTRLTTNYSRCLRLLDGIPNGAEIRDCFVDSAFVDELYNYSLVVACTRIPTP